MPQTVRVTFTPPSTWEFDNNQPIRVERPDDVRFVRVPGSAAWQFDHAEISALDGQTTPELSDSVNPSGEVLTISDSCATKGAWCVVLCVSYTDSSGTTRMAKSPDPQIVNSPSGMTDSAKTIPIVVGLVVGAIVGALIDMHTGASTTQSPFKGAIVGALIGAVVGWMLSRGRKP